MAITVLAQSANQKLYVRSGTLTSDANGFITLANGFGDDLKDLLAQGCVVVPQVSEPSVIQTQFGGALASSPLGFFIEEGNLYRAVGNPFSANLADTTDDILGGIALPANAFDQSGRGLYITAQGKTGATGNNKKMRMWINPTMAGQTVTNGVISGGTVTGAGTGVMVIDSGVSAINAKGWSVQGNLFKYGANASNTQYFQGCTILDSTHSGIGAAQFLTQAENAVMNIVVTGSSSTTGAANDVLLNFLEINAMN